MTEQEVFNLEQKLTIMAAYLVNEATLLRIIATEMRNSIELCAKPEATLSDVGRMLGVHANAIRLYDIWHPIISANEERRTAEAPAVPPDKPLPVQMALAGVIMAIEREATQRGSEPLLDILRRLRNVMS